MKTVNYTNLRSGLADAMDMVCDDAMPLIITRKEQQVVMISKDEYDSLMETVYLLRTPANAKRLFESIEQANRGEAQQQALIDA